MRPETTLKAWPLRLWKTLGKCLLRSAGIIRFQPLAAITIPTSVGMNIVAAVSTGGLNDGIMIGEGFLLIRCLDELITGVSRFFRQIG